MNVTYHISLMALNKDSSERFCVIFRLITDNDLP